MITRVVFNGQQSHSMGKSSARSATNASCFIHSWLRVTWKERQSEWLGTAGDAQQCGVLWLRGTCTSLNFQSPDSRRGTEGRGEAVPRHFNCAVNCEGGEGSARDEWKILTNKAGIFIRFVYGFLPFCLHIYSFFLLLSFSLSHLHHILSSFFGSLISFGRENKIGTWNDKIFVGKFRTWNM